MAPGRNPASCRCPFEFDVLAQNSQKPPCFEPGASHEGLAFQRHFEFVVAGRLTVPVSRSIIIGIVVGRRASAR